MDKAFEFIARNDIFAAISAVLTFWWLISAGVMFLLCLQQKYRFTHWWTISSRERADACLNVSLFLVFLNAAYQRALAAYSFAYREWSITLTTQHTASIYLPLTLFGTALFLWWASYVIWQKRRLCLWLIEMGLGLILFVIIVWLF